jgi:hypothetical protein
MTEMGGIIEFALVAMFAMGWAILEWQGRRLDRKRAEREAQDGDPAGINTAASGTATSPERSGGGSGSATGSHA